jgi:hypothetical protein
LKEACIPEISFLGCLTGTSLGAGGRMLDIAKSRLTQPNLVELALEKRKKYLILTLLSLLDLTLVLNNQ